MVRVAAALLLVAVAGCAEGPSRAQVLAGLVGRPESDALRVLGAPNRTVEANGHRFLAFDEVSAAYPPPLFGPFGYYGFGYVGAGAFPIVEACQTTLEVVGGRVASYSLRGNGC